VFEKCAILTKVVSPLRALLFRLPKADYNGEGITLDPNARSCKQSASMICRAFMSAAVIF